MRIAFTLLSLTALIACASEAPGDEDSAHAELPTRSAPATTVYDAISTTAQSITGALEIADADPVAPDTAPTIRIRTERGGSYTAHWITTQSVTDNAGGTPWSSIMPGAPRDASVAIYRIRNAKEPGSTSMRGLCSPEPTRFIALTRVQETGASDLLLLAVFRGEHWLAEDGEPQLCATFTYALRSRDTTALYAIDTATSVEPPMVSGRYMAPNGHSVTVREGQVVIARPNGETLEGALERDGTAGGRYAVRSAEGSVCGRYAISLWVAEGQMSNGSRFTLEWYPSDGSVAPTCSAFARAAGLFVRSAP